MYQGNFQNELQMKEQQNENFIQEPLPMYGQVEGQKIYMGGLDYSLLQKQKEQNKKKGFLQNLKNQLDSMGKKIDSRSTKVEEKKFQLDQESIKIISTIKQFQNIKPAVNSSTFYIFDTKYHFGSIKPEVITKRMGRMSKQSAYIKVSEDILNKFKKILQRPKTDSQMLNKQKAINKLINKKNEQSQSSSSDNIFGSDEQQQSGYKNNKEQQLFNFGQKLSFGIKDQEIFNKNSQALKKSQQMQVQQNMIDPEKEKYQFLRKKVKRTTNQQENDGYGECYFQSGPTFQQMKESRNQGIQLFGDIKERPKKPQRKVNINQEYNKVKKIIDQKYNK